MNEYPPFLPYGRAYSISISIRTPDSLELYKEHRAHVEIEVRPYIRAAAIKPCIKKGH